LARRTGQLGNVIQFNHTKEWRKEVPAYGRYWLDQPGGGRTRVTVPLGLCATRTIATKRLRDYIYESGVNRTSNLTQLTAPATTFGERAERWQDEMKARRRRPVKPATLDGWRHTLNKWLLPLVGDVRLADCGNKVLKNVIDAMNKQGLSAQTIITHTRVLKMVVASAVNEEGEQLYPRKWNHDFCGLPVIDPTKQHRPTITKPEVERLLTQINPRFQVLVALLAGTGLRIGEALGLQVDDFTDECQVLHVRRSVWQCKVQSPKTPNAVRIVDINEQLGKVLRQYIAGRTGFLFATRDGKPLSQRNVHRAFITAGATSGFHGFRRFRAETLRRERVPEDLVRFWLGHAGASITDTYAGGLRNDVVWRQEWAQRTGLGFSTLGLVGVQNVIRMEVARSA